MSVNDGKAEYDMVPEMSHRTRPTTRPTPSTSALPPRGSSSSSSSSVSPEIHLDVTQELFNNRERLRECMVAEIVEGDMPSSPVEVEESLPISWRQKQNRHLPWDCWNVRAIDDRRILIRFPSREEAEAAVGLILHLRSSKFRLTGCWSPAIGAIPVSEKRSARVWITLKNVPFHAWSPSHFVQMVSGFGRLLDVDPDTAGWANLQEARVEVQVHDGAVIPERLKVALQGQSYWVLVSSDQSWARSSSRKRRRRKPKGRDGKMAIGSSWQWQPKGGLGSTEEGDHDHRHDRRKPNHGDGKEELIEGNTGNVSKVFEQGSLLERVTEKIHGHREDSSSSSDSDNEKTSFLHPPPNHLFGRIEPVPVVLGGGKPADIILWRNKLTSVSIVAIGTVIWILFECMGYNLLTLVCHFLIIAMVVIFFWSNVSSFLNKAPPNIPEVILPEEMFLDIAQTVRYQINEAFATFQNVALGKELKQFLMVIVGLWILSIVGSWFNFLTLSYIVFVVLHTVPVLYERCKDHVDAAAQKALIEVSKCYEVLDATVLQKIPKAFFMSKKKQ